MNSNSAIASGPQFGLILGTDGIIIMLFFFVGLIAAWWASAAFKWDQYFNQPLSPQVQLIRFFFSIAGGILAVAVAILLLGAMQIAKMI